MFELFLLAGTALALAPSTDIAAESLAGNRLCSNPDFETRTCSTITSFRFADDGTVTEESEILLAPHPALTLSVKIASEVDGALNCGTITEESLAVAKVKLDGAELPEDRNALAIERLRTAMGSVIGKRACEILRVENGRLMKYGQVDGLDIPLPGKSVVWISSEDAFTVGPKSGA